MRISDLQIFLSILDTGSFIGAARQHHMTQPAVSKLIHTLEQEVGVSLLERSSGQRQRILPTPAGTCFQNYARSAVDAYQIMRLQIAKSGSEPLSFSVVSSPTPGATVLPALVNQFHSTYAEIQIRSAASADFLENVRGTMLSGAYELGILPEKSCIRELAFEPFFYDPLIPVCPTSFGLKPIISIQEFKRLPLVARPSQSRNMQLVLQALARLHIEFSSLRVRIQVNADADVLRAVAMGSGIGFITRSLYESNLCDTRIQPLHISGLQIERWLYLVSRKNRPLSPAAKIFRDYAFGAQWRGAFEYPMLPSGPPPALSASPEA